LLVADPSRLRGCASFHLGHGRDAGQARFPVRVLDDHRRFAGDHGLRVDCRSHQMGCHVMADYRTSLSRVRGLGTIRGGTDHFWYQRLTGVANLVLLVFLIFTVIRLAGEPYVVMRGYFASPLVTVLGIAMAISVAYHMRLGMQVIIEDYIHTEGTKFVL